MRGQVDTAGGGHARAADKAGVPDRRAGQSRGAFDLAGGDVGANVLRAGRGTRGLRPFTPDTLGRRLKDGNGASLMARAENLARTHGFTLTSGAPRNNAGLKALLDELKRKAPVCVALMDSRDDDNPDGKLTLVQFKVLGEADTMRIIMTEPTFRMRPETGLLARRFIRTLYEKTGIDIITNIPDTEYQIDCWTDELDWARRNNPDEAREIEADMDHINDYLPGGKVTKAFEEFRNLKPLTKAEAAAFVPEDEAEERLLQTILDGFSHIESGTDVLNYDIRWNEWLGESWKEQNESDIGTEQTIMIAYDYDGMVEAITDNLDSLYQSGCVPAPLVVAEEIPSAGGCSLDSSPGLMLDWLDRLINAIENPALIRKTQTEKDKNETRHN